jgi:hypothetical protein
LHEVPLKVRVVLGDSLASSNATTSVDIDDPILAAGRELGAEIHPVDEQRKRS